MFSNDERVIYAKRQLVEVICQLRFPEILKIDVSEPADFQERIRRDYPQYEKKIEQLPPQMVNGKPVPQGTVNNYQFVSAEGQWRVSLTKGFIALSTYGYTRWEDFAQRLDRVLAAFIETYHPSWFTRVGLRYVNAFRREALGLDGMLWKELITPGFLGLMGEEDAQETAFLKHAALRHLPGAGWGEGQRQIRPGPAAQGQQSHPRDDRGKGLHAGSRSVYGQQDRARAGRPGPRTSSTKTPGACSAPP